MWRFLLPGFAMVAAMLLLLAGALGDLEAWRHWPTGILTQQGMRPADTPTAPADQASSPFEGRGARAVPPPPLTSLPPIPLAPAPPPAAPPPTAAPPEPPQPEAAAPAKENVRPPPASPQPQAPPEDKPQDAEAAKQQAGQIREALDRIRTRHATAPEPPAATQPMPRPIPTQPMRPPGATQPMPAPPVPAAAPPSVTAPADTPQQSLVAARAALAMRQGAEARRLLGVAQFRILFRRPLPDQPPVMVDQRPAAAIAHAAASLDVGDYNAADRSIAFALAIIDGGTVGR